MRITATQKHALREGVIAQAIKEGKFPASRADHYRRAFDNDPNNALDLIAGLPPSAAMQEAQPISPETYPSEWLTPRERQIAAGTVQPRITIARD